MSRQFDDMLKLLEPKAMEAGGYQHIAVGSIAISLKRIADALEAIDAPGEQGRNLSEKLYFAIYNSISQSRAG